MNAGSFPVTKLPFELLSLLASFIYDTDDRLAAKINLAFDNEQEIIQAKQSTFGNFLAALVPHIGVSVCLQLWEEWHLIHGFVLCFKERKFEWTADSSVLIPLLDELARLGRCHLFCRVVNTILIIDELNLQTSGFQGILQHISLIVCNHIISVESVLQIFRLLYRITHFRNLSSNDYHLAVLFGAIESKRIDVVSRLIDCADYGNADTSKVLWRVASSGSVELLQKLKEHGYRMPVGLIFGAAMLNKHIDVARWTVLNGDIAIEWSRSFPGNLAAYDRDYEYSPFNIETAMMTIEFGYPYNTIMTAERASQNGDFDFLIWLLDQGGSFDVRKISAAAALAGHVHILKFCERAFGKQKIHPRILLLRASKFCHIEVLEWCIRTWIISQTILDESLSCAAAFGQFDALIFLLKHGANWGESRIDRSMIWNFSIIRHLWSQNLLNDDEKTQAFTMAISLGLMEFAEWSIASEQQLPPLNADLVYEKLTDCYRPDIIFWLQEKLHIDPPAHMHPKIVDNAALSGRLDILRRIEKSLGFDCAFLRRDQHKAYIAADYLYNDIPCCDLPTNIARMGRLDILQFIHLHGAPHGKFVCAAAASRGRLDIIKWALNHGYKFEKLVCHIAAACGHYDILKWVIEQGCEWDPVASIAVVRDRNLDIVRMIQERNLPWHDKALENAIKEERMHSLLWVKDNNIPCPVGRTSYSKSSFVGHKAAVIMDWLHQKGIKVLETTFEELYEREIAKMFHEANEEGTENDYSDEKTATLSTQREQLMNGTSLGTNTTAKTDHLHANLLPKGKWKWNGDVKYIFRMAMRNGIMHLVDRILKDSRAAGADEDLSSYLPGMYGSGISDGWKLLWAIENGIQIPDGVLMSALEHGALCVIRAAFRAGYTARSMLQDEDGMWFDCYNMKRLLASEGFVIETLSELRKFHYAIAGFPLSEVCDEFAHTRHVDNIKPDEYDELYAGEENERCRHCFDNILDCSCR